MNARMTMEVSSAAKRGKLAALLEQSNEAAIRSEALDGFTSLEALFDHVFGGEE